MSNHIAFSVILALNFFLALSSDTKPGPPGPVKIYKITECDPPVNFVKFKAEIIEEPNGSDSLKCSLNLAYPIDADVTTTIKAVRYDSETKQWIDDGYNFEDKPLLPFLNQLIPNIFNNFKSKVVPKMEDPDAITANEYQIEHFTASHTDVTVSVVYGLFDSQVEITQQDEKILCMKVQLEFFPPVLTAPELGK